MGFSASGSSISIGNSTELAAAIGAAVPQPGAFTSTGSRLVDTASRTISRTIAGIDAVPPYPASQIDCSDAISYSLQVVACSAAAANGTVTVQLIWRDASDTIITAVQTYEFNCGRANIPITTYLVDRCLGPRLSIYYLDSSGLSGNLLLTTKLTTSSRPSDRPRVTVDRIAAGGSAGWTGDGFLGIATSPTLAANTACARYIFALTTGRIMVRANAVSAACSFSFFSGAGSTPMQPITVATPPIGVDALFEIPALNRPLSVVVTNTSATVAAGYTALAWTNGD